MATGGSTNLVIHLVAMARAAGVVLDPSDFADISAATPLMARVYPNGLADVNHFHAAGGLGYMIGELLDAGLLHPDTQTVAGTGLSLYTREPKLDDGVLAWEEGARLTLNDKILRPASEPFQPTGGLVELEGNLGRGVMKVSAVSSERHLIEAPAAVFQDQSEVKDAFRAGELDRDVVVVVRFQGPKANGMPELHALTPVLAVLQDRGHKVALVTDGRMSGASGKVPSAIHVAPEALDGGPIGKVRDGDIIRVDAANGRLEVLAEGVADRDAATPDLSGNAWGVGRELFEVFRDRAGPATEGAGVVV
jgi:phosphogluconate dehydratase